MVKVFSPRRQSRDLIIQFIIFLIGFISGSIWSASTIVSESLAVEPSSSSLQPVVTTTRTRSSSSEAAATNGGVAATTATKTSGAAAATTTTAMIRRMESQKKEQQTSDTSSPSDRHGLSTTSSISSSSSLQKGTLSTSGGRNNNNNNEGWQSIDVYYGSTDIREQELPKGQKWFSQVAQDQVVSGLLKQMHGGYFIDLASNDATILSNTYVLEKEYDWNGLCIEPNPIYWYNLTHYRPNCQIVGAIVGQTTKEKIHFRYNALEHGGIVGNDHGFDNRARFKKESKQEYTIQLLDIFERYDVPKVIDYLSLDVEGAEHFVMSNFPLSQYKIKVMTVERPKPELVQLLESHNYIQLQRLSTWGEQLYANKQFLQDMDVSQLQPYHSSKQTNKEI